MKDLGILLERGQDWIGRSLLGGMLRVRRLESGHVRGGRGVDDRGHTSCGSDRLCVRSKVVGGGCEERNCRSSRWSL